MVWGILIICLVVTSTLSIDTPSHMDNLKELLPLLKQTEPLPQKDVINQFVSSKQTSQKLLQQQEKQALDKKLEQTFQQIKPMSYKVNNVPSNYPSDRCSPSYNSVTTLLPILGMLLEFLDHSSESEKAYLACELIKKYLESAPPSQEKVAFLEKLRVVKEHLLFIQASNHRVHKKISNPQKTIILFQQVPPGTDQQNCRETLDRLIQTAVNVYKESAKYPQCQPSGFIDENLYYPNSNVKPNKPYDFVVIYPNPPSSYYSPDYSGISMIPNNNVKPPSLNNPYLNLQLKYPKINIPNEDNIGQYNMPSGQNPNNPFKLPQKAKSYFDVLALIRQYNILHPGSSKNENNFLQSLGNLTVNPSYDYKPSLSVNDYLNPSILQNNPGSPFSHIYPSGAHQFPGMVSDQLQNFPGLVHPNPDLDVPTYQQPENGYIPSTVYINPENPVNTPYHIYGEHNVPTYQQPDSEYIPSTVYIKPENLVHNPYHIYGEHNLPGTGIVGDSKLQLDKVKAKPELSLEILLGLLGHPEGVRSQQGSNPQLESQLWQYLRPDNGNTVNQNLPNNPYENQNYIVYGSDGLPVKQSLLDNLKQIQPDTQTGVYTGKKNPDDGALLKKLQQWLAVSNGNKLPQSQNNANVIELTYVLKRPKPLIYRPIYYVKYRLPYEAFVQNFQNLILKKPGLRSEPENLYQDLVSVSNISDVSPSLKGISKEEILKLVFGNGTLVDARVVDMPDSVLNEQLDATRKLNAEIDPKVIEELSSNLNLSEDNPNLGDGLDWLKPKPVSKHEDMAVHGLDTPLNKPGNLVDKTSSGIVPEGSSTSNQAQMPSVDSDVPIHPLNVAPPIYSTPL